MGSDAPAGLAVVCAEAATGGWGDGLAEEGSHRDGGGGCEVGKGGGREDGKQEGPRNAEKRVGVSHIWRKIFPVG